MNDQLELMIRLQDLDRQAAGLRARLAEIPPRIEEGRAGLDAAEGALGEGRSSIEATRKERRQAEKDLDAQIDRRRKFEEQQSKVKTNKEYQALMGELESHKAEETRLEDHILALMEGQSEIEKRLPALSAEVERERELFAKEEQELRADEGRLQAELEQVEAARAAVAAGLKPAALQTYERVARLRGTAVAEVREELCLGCRTKLPPQQYVEAMRNDSLTACPHCHRVLHYKPPEISPPRADREPEGEPQHASAAAAPAPPPPEGA